MERERASERPSAVAVDYCLALVGNVREGDDEFAVTMFPTAIVILSEHPEIVGHKSSHISWGGKHSAFQLLFFLCIVWLPSYRSVIWDSSRNLTR